MIYSTHNNIFDTDLFFQILINVRYGVPVIKFARTVSDLLIVLAKTSTHSMLMDTRVGRTMVIKKLIIVRYY